MEAEKRHPRLYSDWGTLLLAVTWTIRKIPNKSAERFLLDAYSKVRVEREELEKKMCRV